jgi:hypothetical protein
MFRKNERHQQKDLFSFHESLPESYQKLLKESEEYKFYELIFCNIDEDIFKILYSEVESRPNAPVNSMVATLILKERYDWSYSEFFKQMGFNLLTKTALGINHIEEIPFCQSTLFYFQNKLNEHYLKTEENLLEKVFDKLTTGQIKELNIKTKIQRTDSFLAASNIRRYSRLQLLIEVLLRLYRVFNDDDKEKFKKLLSEYTSQSSAKYIYGLKGSDLPKQIDKLGDIYYRLYSQIKVEHPSFGKKYSEKKEFQIFERVYKEHFKETEEKVVVRSSEELSSSCLQSPDDIDATYRNKNGNISKGQSINIVETANPENQIELINDVSVRSNNVNDEKILNERIDRVKEKTPDFEELHFDGAYGSKDNDEKFEELVITPVQTAIKGRKAEVPITITKKEDDQYKVSCPYQSVEAVLSAKKYKAEFDLAICNECQLSEKCPALKNKHFRTYNFTKEDYLKNKRHNSINHIPEERRKLRNNVEATVAEFKRKLNNGKLKVRGYFKTVLFAFSMAISINFGRIYRYLAKI